MYFTLRKFYAIGFQPSTEVVHMCVHNQELLDIVNNQSTLEGFNLDDVKVMLRELCEN